MQCESPLCRHEHACVRTAMTSMAHPCSHHMRGDLKQRGIRGKGDVKKHVEYKDSHHNIFIEMLLEKS